MADTGDKDNARPSVSAGDTRSDTRSGSVTLADQHDVCNFRFGDRRALIVELAQTGVIDHDEARRALRPRWRRWLAWKWQRVTRWWRPRTIVSAVDTEAGSITVKSQRWSWLRWRWLP